MQLYIGHCISIFTTFRTYPQNISHVAISSSQSHHTCIMFLETCGLSLHIKGYSRKKQGGHRLEHFWTPLPQIEIGYCNPTSNWNRLTGPPHPKLKLSAYPPNLNYFILPHLDCLNVQLTPPPFLVPNEWDILFIMYFVIAPNANKMRIHTDQLMKSKCTCIVYFESWPCQIDC